MAISSYPFDGQSITETEYSRYFRELQDSGVVGSTDTLDFKVTADGSGMTVKVQAGFAILRGHAVFSTAVETLPIAAAGTAARQDRIVLRLDPAANSITLAVLRGTAGGAAPSPTQTDVDIYELALGVVTVGANTTNVPSGAVVDGRRFTGSRVGVWTSATRPSAPRVGQMGYNRTLTTWEFWNGSAWGDFAPSATWANVSGKPTSFAPGPHTHVWADITGKPSTYAPATHSHTWSSITSTPSTFPPSSHSHTWSSITSKPSTFTPSSHSHSGYLTSGSTISWANGSKKPHSNAASGSGTWYAVWVEGDGTFARNTSSIRFKENVRDHPIDPDGVLALRPVIYDRKTQVDDRGTVKEGRKDEVGLIAEEVEPHLPWLVNYLDGEIDGLRYDLLGVALIPVVQRQESRIESLEERLAGLEASAGRAG